MKNRVVGAAILALIILACGGRGDAPDPEPPASEPPASEPPATEQPATQPPATQPPAAEPPTAEPSYPAPAPWSAEALSADEVPAVFLEQWRRAENRETCALLAPVWTGRPAAEPRAASFAGGWAVAWDLPGTRSAFGVAGTGVEPSEDTYDDWPFRVRWADGSRAGYGPEGGSGPNQLAYLRVAGQRCLYNVWSRLGVEHLERLLESLRYVRG